MIFYGMKEGEHVIGVLSGMAGTWWYMGPILGGRQCSIRNTGLSGTSPSLSPQECYACCPSLPTNGKNLVEFPQSFYL